MQKSSIKIHKSYKIQDVKTISRNFAPNGICEFMHQTLGFVLQLLILETNPCIVKNGNRIWIKHSGNGIKQV